MYLERKLQQYCSIIGVNSKQKGRFFVISIVKFYEIREKPLTNSFEWGMIYALNSLYSTKANLVYFREVVKL